MGRDATVSWGGPDFAFRNDLKTGILIKTSYTELDADVQLLRHRSRPPQSSRHGRARELALAADDVRARPYAPRGSVRTVSGSNQSGFDVTVTRKVYERGKLKRQDAFTSAYIAVGPTQIYGPGRSIPGPVLRAAAPTYCGVGFLGGRHHRGPS